MGHGKLSKARHRLIRPKRREGITKYLREFKVGEKVIIKIDSSSQNFPNPRHQGLIGEVIEKRGSAYIVDLPVGKKSKKLIITPEHLKRQNIQK